MPRKAAADVARIARKVLRTDKTQRRALYQALGMEPDGSVEDAD